MIISDRQELEGLRISLVDLPNQPGAFQEYDFTVELPQDFNEGAVEVDSKEPIPVHIVLTSVSEGVLVDLSTQVHVHGECARCLDPVARSFDIHTQELFYNPGMRAKALAEGDETAEEMMEIEAESIDVETLLRDSILLELPARLLCSQDCEGLCPQCALPYRELELDHHHDVIDNRWASLAGLAQQLRDADEEKV